MSAWLFQGTPLRFDVNAYLSSVNPIWWTVGPATLGRSIAPGDRAFVWRADGGAKGTGGLVAVGRILASPAVVDEASLDGAELWRQVPTEPAVLKAPIELDEVRLTPVEGMLLRTELLRHPLLSGLHVLGYRASITYTVTSDQERALLALWDDRRTAEAFRLVPADNRRVITASVVVREGQDAFRASLLVAYGGRCAVTGEGAEPVLDAAHIQPYLGPASNHPQNGLLLRADVHRLFDDGYLAVDPETLAVIVSRRLADFGNGTAYHGLAGREIRLPLVDGDRPSRHALWWHLRHRFLA